MVILWFSHNGSAAIFLPSFGRGRFPAPLYKERRFSGQQLSMQLAAEVSGTKTPRFLLKHTSENGQIDSKRSPLSLVPISARYLPHKCVFWAFSFPLTALVVETARVFTVVGETHQPVSQLRAIGPVSGHLFAPLLVPWPEISKRPWLSRAHSLGRVIRSFFIGLFCF